MHQRETLTLLNYEVMLQRSIEQGIVENFAKFIEAEGKSRTGEMKPNSRMHIKVKYTSRHEDFKFSSRKRKKTNKYHLTARKVKMK